MIKEYGQLKKTHRGFSKLKGCSDSSHLIFEINVGKRRIRQTTTVKYNSEFLDRQNS